MSERIANDEQVHRLDDSTALQFTISEAEPTGPSPVYLKLLIANVSQVDLWINRRLLVGPHNSQDREVWLDIVSASDGKPIQENSCFGKGIPRGPLDYMLLPTGATYSLVLPLRCYRFADASRWRIVGHYQDPVLRTPPPGDVQWFGGTVISNEIDIEMKGRVQREVHQ